MGAPSVTHPTDRPNLRPGTTASVNVLWHGGEADGFSITIGHITLHLEPFQGISLAARMSVAVEERDRAYRDPNHPDNPEPF